MTSSLNVMDGFQDKKVSLVRLVGTILFKERELASLLIIQTGKFI